MIAKALEALSKNLVAAKTDGIEEQLTSEIGRTALAIQRSIADGLDMHLSSFRDSIFALRKSRQMPNAVFKQLQKLNEADTMIRHGSIRWLRDLEAQVQAVLFDTSASMPPDDKGDAAGHDGQHSFCESLVESTTSGATAICVIDESTTDTEATLCQLQERLSSLEAFILEPLLCLISINWTRRFVYGPSSPRRMITVRTRCFLFQQ